jgi:hypothetical protein
MTTVTPTIKELPTTSQGFKCWQVQWPAMANGQTGVPVDLVEFSDRSVQVEGTFGSGGSVSIQGSNDLTNWETLRDPSSTALTFTTAGLHGILELTGQIRPNVTAGDGTTALTVTVVVRRTWR